VQLQALSKAHLDRVVSELLESGRRSGNVQRQSLSPRTINLALTLLSSVLEDAVRQGSLSRNVAKMVEHPRQTRKDMQTWTAEQAGAFLEAVTDHRMSAAWQLSLYGLRRGEVLGLTWGDIDRSAQTLTVRRARVEVGGAVVEGEPKTERGKRTLPLDEPMVASLRALRTQQARERLSAGEAYTTACDACGGEHLVLDELGWPLRPELYSDTFQKLSRAAGLPVIRLHDARHTSVTLMILNGVPVPVVSKWHGHASAAFTMNNYAHSQDDALTAAGALLGSVIRKSQGAVK